MTATLAGRRDAEVNRRGVYRVPWGCRRILDLLVALADCREVPASQRRRAARARFRRLSTCSPHMRMKYSGSNDGTGLITRKLGPYEPELRARRGPHLPTTAMPDPEAEDELALRFYTACFDGSLGEVKDIVQSEEAEEQ